jgi:ribose 5-phosphate isomerase B
MKKIIIGSDHAGFKLKETLKSFLKKKGFRVDDVGTYSAESCDYPYFASLVAQRISSGRHKRGILICKSGIGNTIVANRFPKVRAALCYNLRASRLSREDNDSNVLVLGSAFIRPYLAKRITSVWLKSRFAGGRHSRRVNQIEKITRLVKR